MWTISTTWIAKNEKGKDDNFKDNRKENRNGKCQKSTKMALLWSLSFVEIKNEIKNDHSNYYNDGAIPHDSYDILEHCFNSCRNNMCPKITEVMVPKKTLISILGSMALIQSARWDVLQWRF